MDEMGNGLVIIYDPHNLYEFLWYYTSYGKNLKWTALCLPNGDKGEYMSKYCKNSGVFENVISSDDSYLESGIVSKISLFAKMFAYALVNKQKKFCKKILGRYVNVDDYETICVLTDIGIVSGAAVAFGDEKNVIIFEDGIGDYAVRTNKFHLKYLKNIYNLTGFFIAKMGYSNPGHYFELKTTKNCTKFSMYPQKMPYQNYKCHEKLYDFHKTDLKMLNKICADTYKELHDIDFSKYDAIIFTEAFNAFGIDSEIIIKRTCEEIQKKYSNVLIKKHPLDGAEYDVCGNLNIKEISREIPGEVLISCLHNIDIVFMGMSTLLMYLTQYKDNIYFYYYKDIYDKSKGNGYLNYPSIEYVESYIGKYGYKKEQIINI